MELHELRAEISPTAVSTLDELLQEHELANWRLIEDVPGRRAWIAGISEREGELQEQWNELAVRIAEAGIALLDGPASTELAEEEWRDSYKVHFRAWQFGRLHWVPVWERGSFSLPEGDLVLWLDPGLAFGTGNHETTRLCVERLVAVAGEKGSGGRVIDAGCGSGILALSAALLGFRDILGFDNDPEAIRVSEANAVENGLEGRVRFYVGDLTTGFGGNQAEIVLANIQSDVLIKFAPPIVDAVAPGGALVLSGILASENSQVRTEFERFTPGWSVNARTMGDWSDVVLERPLG